MIAIAKQNRTRKSVPAWHAGFLAMVPAIATYARLAFRHRNPEARQEAVEECLANALVAYVRLVQLGKVNLAYPTVLARYAVAQVNDGRKVGGHLNIGDVMSSYCQRQKKITIERLDQVRRGGEPVARGGRARHSHGPGARNRCLPLRFSRLARSTWPTQPQDRPVPRPQQPHQRCRPEVRRVRRPHQPVAKGVQAGVG